MKLASMVRVAEREGDLRKGTPQKAGIVAGSWPEVTKAGEFLAALPQGGWGLGRERRQEKQAR